MCMSYCSSWKMNLFFFFHCLSLSSSSPPSNISLTRKIRDTTVGISSTENGTPTSHWETWDHNKWWAWRLVQTANIRHSYSWAPWIMTGKKKCKPEYSILFYKEKHLAKHWSFRALLNAFSLIPHIVNEKTETEQGNTIWLQFWRQSQKWDLLFLTPTLFGSPNPIS